MKAYTLGIHGFLPSQVLKALGLPSHIRQASIIIVAKSKRAAAALAEERHIYVTLSDPEFRVADGWPVADAIREFAGDQPGVFALASLARAGAPIVEIQADGVRVVGHAVDGGQAEMGSER